MRASCALVFVCATRLGAEARECHLSLRPRTQLPDPGTVVQTQPDKQAAKVPAPRRHRVSSDHRRLAASPAYTRARSCASLPSSPLSGTLSAETNRLSSCGPLSRRPPRTPLVLYEYIRNLVPHACLSRTS